MKLSVLITYYNQADFVKRSLDSVLDQNFNQDFEILVGDDGSKDETLSILKEYINKYPLKIKLFQMPREEGLKYDAVQRASANRLNLLSKAQGEYFCFLDGDDFYINRSFFKEGLRVLDQAPELASCVFDHAIVDEEDMATLNPYAQEAGLMSYAQYLPASYIHVGARVFRRFPGDFKLELIKSMGLFDDNIISFYMMGKGASFYVPDPVYGYCLHKDGIWTGSHELEQHLANALDFKLARRLIPAEGRDYTFLRYYHPMTYVFNHKGKIDEVLSPDKVETYLQKSRLHNSPFIESLLIWDRIDHRKRRRALSYYRQFKKKAREIFNKRKDNKDGN